MTSSFIFFHLFILILNLSSNFCQWIPPPKTGIFDTLICGYGYAKMQVHEDEFSRPSAKDITSNTPEYEASIESLGELVYHTDYHGVTTHPNPTPKHP